MIAAITGLLLCQLAGEIFVRALALPLPGPVAGMGLMFAVLAWRGRQTETGVPTELGRVADTLLANLSLLFIPAAVGVVQYLDLLRRFAAPITVAIAVSTTAALAITALTFRVVSNLRTDRGAAEAETVDTNAGRNP